MSREQRHFHRIALQGDVIIIHGDADMRARLLDVSLKGALTGRPSNWAGRLNDRCTLILQFAGTADPVTMDCRVAHAEPGRLGFHCLHINIDSASFLKRLVELNVGDPALLERELASLGK